MLTIGRRGTSYMYGGDECDGLRCLYILSSISPCCLIPWRIAPSRLTLASKFGTYINGASSYIEFGSILKN